MILSHPQLFYTIVVLFIAFTSGWLVYTLTGSRAAKLKKKMKTMMAEKEKLQQQVQKLEEHLKSKPNASTPSTTPVIPLTAKHRANKTNGR
jgi:cell division protein FtsB